MKMPNRESTPSCGNVFADLNLPQADDLLAKAELAAKIVAEIQRRRLTQSQAAAILGIDQPKVSVLKQGKLSGFSIERLMRFLLLLGRDIEITVKGKSRSRSAARLRVACTRGPEGAAMIYPKRSMDKTQPRDHAERLGKAVIEALAPGSTMEYRDHQSQGARVYDFDLRFVDGRVAAVEVTAAMNEARTRANARIMDRR